MQGRMGFCCGEKSSKATGCIVESSVGAQRRSVSGSDRGAGITNDVVDRQARWAPDERRGSSEDGR